MFSKNKSKVLQALEEVVPPIDEDDTIEMIAQMVRQPQNNPIEVGLRLGKIDKEHSIMHLESQFKLHQAMEHFDATPEQLDKVMPVSDEELNELVDMSAAFYEDDDDDDDDADEGDDLEKAADEINKLSGEAADDKAAAVAAAAGDSILKRYNLSDMFL